MKMTQVHNTLQNENYQMSKMSIFYLSKLLKGGYITWELYTINTKSYWQKKSV